MLLVVTRVCECRDRLSGHDYIATSYIDIVKTSRPGSDQSDEDGLYIDGLSASALVFHRRFVQNTSAHYRAHHLPG